MEHMFRRDHSSRRGGGVQSENAREAADHAVVVFLGCGKEDPRFDTPGVIFPDFAWQAKGYLKSNKPTGQMKALSVKV